MKKDPLLLLLLISCHLVFSIFGEGLTLTDHSQTQLLRPIASCNFTVSGTGFTELNPASYSLTITTSRCTVISNATSRVGETELTFTENDLSLCYPTSYTPQEVLWGVLTMHNGSTSITSNSVGIGSLVKAIPYHVHLAPPTVGNSLLLTGSGFLAPNLANYSVLFSGDGCIDFEEPRQPDYRAVGGVLYLLGFNEVSLLGCLGFLYAEVSVSTDGFPPVTTNRVQIGYAMTLLDTDSHLITGDTTYNSGLPVRFSGETFNPLVLISPIAYFTVDYSAPEDNCISGLDKYGLSGAGDQTMFTSSVTTSGCHLGGAVRLKLHYYVTYNSGAFTINNTFPSVIIGRMWGVLPFTSEFYTPDQLILYADNQTIHIQGYGFVSSNVSDYTVELFDCVPQPYAVSSVVNESSLFVTGLDFSDCTGNYVDALVRFRDAEADISDMIPLSSIVVGPGTLVQQSTHAEFFLEITRLIEIEDEEAEHAYSPVFRVGDNCQVGGSTHVRSDGLLFTLDLAACPDAVPPLNVTLTLTAYGSLVLDNVRVFVMIEGTDAVNNDDDGDDYTAIYVSVGCVGGLLLLVAAAGYMWKNRQKRKNTEMMGVMLSETIDP